MYATRDDHALQPAILLVSSYRERMHLIRQRVADGAYNHPSVIAHIARRLLDTAGLH
jgi:hypothetical protein